MEGDESMDTKAKMKNRTGFDLFLRFAESCRRYLEKINRISPEDNEIIKQYLYSNGKKPPEAVIKRVFYVAYPGLKKVQKRLNVKSMFEPAAVREFYAFDHNKMKFLQRDLVCIAYPAQVLAKSPKRENTYKFEFEPVSCRVWLKSDIELNIGEWVMIHRMIVVERATKNFAEKVISFLKDLGLNKEYKFPDKAIKYLINL
ncbi:MAG: hypothetical protein DRP13_03555 [Candidatus Aenigmatarchaeota archaeon]|nr:MAG: hypothetical protein DRP13_03555 [Candidatus Aenigmarchaeota archaeon]